MTSPDWRRQFVPKLDRFEKQVMAEMAVEQVRHISLESYQPGQPHYEQLITSMALQQASRWPRGEEG